MIAIILTVMVNGHQVGRLISEGRFATMAACNAAIDSEAKAREQARAMIEARYGLPAQIAATCVSLAGDRAT